MQLHFSKYQSAGNDYILVDNRAGLFKPNSSLVSSLCNRNYGIGAHGLMILEKDSNADFRMRFFSPDGDETTMSGNGGHCLVKFAHRLGIITQNASFVGIDGHHAASVIEEGVVSLRMKDIDEVETDEDHYLIDSGSPHYVHFVEDLDRVDVLTEGRLIHRSFNPARGGVNVNFVQITPLGVRVRTYERGIENETLASGAGAVASVVAVNHWLESEQCTYLVETRGGSMEVSFGRKLNGNYHDIWLKGTTVHVFDGVVGV